MSRIINCRNESSQTEVCYDSRIMLAKLCVYGDGILPAYHPFFRRLAGILCNGVMIHTLGTETVGGVYVSESV